MSAIGRPISSLIPANARVLDSSNGTTRYDVTGDGVADLEKVEMNTTSGKTLVVVRELEAGGGRTVYSDSGDGFVHDVRKEDRRGTIVAFERDWNENNRLDAGDELWNEKGQFRINTDGTLQDLTPLISDALPIPIYRSDPLPVMVGKAFGNLAVIPFALLYGMLHQSHP